MLKIPPDYTFLVQIVLFVALWLLLKRWWFDPALRVIRERNARSDGAIVEAKRVQAEAEQLRARHAAALDQARDEAQREMQEVVRTAETEQKRLLDEARADAQRTLDDARGRIAEDVTVARRDLRSQAEKIAREVAQKVLGRAI